MPPFIVLIYDRTVEGGEFMTIRRTILLLSAEPAHAAEAKAFPVTQH